jgi:HD superfamily phosphohydrolase
MKHCILIILAIAIQAKAICGTQIDGAKTAEEARQRAAASLAIAINSKLSFYSKSEETIDGRKSSQKDTTIQKTNSKLLNAHYAKYEDGKNESGHSSKACMPNEKAAKPYLDSLSRLNSELANSANKKTNSELCKTIVEIYSGIKNLEGILENLEQMNSAIKGKYEPVYAKAKEECEQAGKRGIYLGEIKGARAQTISDKIQEVLTSNKCRMEQKQESNSFTINIDAKDCNMRNDGVFAHCSACAKVEVIDGKNEKSGLVASITEKGSWSDKETACENAAKATAPEIWNRVKDKIKEACE